MWKNNATNNTRRKHGPDLGGCFVIGVVSWVNKAKEKEKKREREHLNPELLRSQAILFPQLLLLTVVVAWADGHLGLRVWWRSWTWESLGKGGNEAPPLKSPSTEYIGCEGRFLINPIRLKWAASSVYIAWWNFGIPCNSTASLSASILKSRSCWSRDFLRWWSHIRLSLCIYRSLIAKPPAAKHSIAKFPFRLCVL